jgi:hypothetical protein
MFVLQKAAAWVGWDNPLRGLLGYAKTERLKVTILGPLSFSSPE